MQTYGFANCKFNPVSLATFVESVRWADTALNSLTLDSNAIFGKLPDRWGDGAEPDMFAADCDAFLVALKTSSIRILSLQNTGIGPVALRTLATSLPAVLTKVDIRGADIVDAETFDAVYNAFKSVAPDGCKI